MKPSRLAELQRQRELVRSHLAWLDREIASSLGHAPNQTPSPAPVLAHLAAPTPPHPALTAEPDPITAAATARRGCFIFAALAAVLLLGTLAGIYFVKYRDRPLLFPEASHAPEANP